MKNNSFLGSFFFCKSANMKNYKKVKNASFLFLLARAMT